METGGLAGRFELTGGRSAGILDHSPAAQPPTRSAAEGPRMIVRGLSEAEFLATFVEPMRNLSAIAVDHGDDAPSLEGGVVDIWPYVAAVPWADLSGEEVRPQEVDGVYRSGDGRWDHVMVATGTQNVHLVVVVDLTANRVYGHHLLDLNSKYGVARQPRHAEPGAAADGGA